VNGRTRRALLTERYGSLAGVERERIAAGQRPRPTVRYVGDGGPDTVEAQSMRRRVLVDQITNDNEESQ
jgi:hypothetical protein